MIKKGDKVMIVRDNCFAIVCEDIGVNRNGNSVVKLDIYRRTGERLDIRIFTTLKYIETKKYTAYSFEEAVDKFLYDEVYGKRPYEVEF